MRKGAQLNMPGTYLDTREKCDEGKGNCGRVQGLVGGHICGDWSQPQLSLVDSRGPTHQIENPRLSGCGKTLEFEGTSKKIRVESKLHKEMSNPRGLQNAIFSPEVNSKALNHISLSE